MANAAKWDRLLKLGTDSIEPKASSSKTDDSYEEFRLPLFNEEEPSSFFDENGKFRNEVGAYDDEKENVHDNNTHFDLSCLDFDIKNIYKDNVPDNYEIRNKSVLQDKTNETPTTQEWPAGTEDDKQPKPQLEGVAETEVDEKLINTPTLQEERIAKTDDDEQRIQSPTPQKERSAEAEEDEQPIDQEDELLESGNDKQKSELNVRPNQRDKLGLTKDGKPRRRRKFYETVEERQAKKIQKLQDKYYIKSPCTMNCKKKCSTKITQDQRLEIHSQYNNMNWEAQGLFIKDSVDKNEVSIRIQTSKEGNPKRMVTYRYYFKTQNLSQTEVCKTFFLTTLGYNAKNDSRVMVALSKSIDKQKTERGSYERKNKIDKDIIKQHIMRYEPYSYNRCEHAPEELYMPSDLTITSMHNQFLKEYPGISISLEFYRKVVTEDLHISFNHLRKKECEQCAHFKMHDENHIDNPDESCDVCTNYRIHLNKYIQTCMEYRNDEDLAADDDATNIHYSVDLQKVVMLPRMNQFKAEIFCPRIIAFNESFVPLGSKDGRALPFAVVWHETISGGRQEDIISAFRAFLLHKRDAEHIILWLDNCTAQNKNWALLTFLVQIVNSTTIAAKTITLKFFEHGHAFMSADSFHHQVELSLKRKDKVYDFEDFVECVRTANSKQNFVKVMEISDFIEFPKDLTSPQKLRKITPLYLRDIIAVKVEKGLFTLKYKNSYNSEYQILDFLQEKIIKTKQFPEAHVKTKQRGITEERKAEIISKLVPLMPENRRKFWYDLPTSIFNVPLDKNAQ